jgi:hypothetical protein
VGLGDAERAAAPVLDTAGGGALARGEHVPATACPNDDGYARRAESRDGGKAPTLALVDLASVAALAACISVRHGLPASLQPTAAAAIVWIGLALVAHLPVWNLFLDRWTWVPPGAAAAGLVRGCAVPTAA